MKSGDGARGRPVSAHQSRCGLWLELKDQLQRGRCAPPGGNLLLFVVFCPWKLDIKSLGKSVQNVSKGVLQSQNTEVKMAQLKCFLEHKGPHVTSTLPHRLCPNICGNKCVTTVDDSNISETTCLSSIEINNFSHS